MIRSAHPKWVLKLQSKIKRNRRRGLFLFFLPVLLAVIIVLLFIHSEMPWLNYSFLLASIPASILCFSFGIRDRKTFVRTRKIYGHTICFVSDCGKNYLVIEGIVHDEAISQQNYHGELPDGYPILVQFNDGRVIISYHDRSTDEVCTIE